MSMSGLPPVEDNNNELPDFPEDREEQILQIIFRENEDDASVLDVDFIGENIDPSDKSQVFAALAFAMKTVVPDTNDLIEALRLLDEEEASL